LGHIPGFGITTVPDIVPDWASTHGRKAKISDTNDIINTALFIFLDIIIPPSSDILYYMLSLRKII
jgi:hypothetical protein